MSGLWEAEIKEDRSIEMHDGTGKWLIKFFNIKENSFEWQWNFQQPDSTMKTMVKIKGVRIGQK